MQIVHFFINMELPYAQSLKGRRKVIASIKAKLKHLNLSVADISKEYIKEASIEGVFLAKSKNEALKKLQRIEKLLDPYLGEVEYELEYEII